MPLQRPSSKSLAKASGPKLQGESQAYCPSVPANLRGPSSRVSPWLGAATRPCEAPERRGKQRCSHVPHPGHPPPSHQPSCCTAVNKALGSSTSTTSGGRAHCGCPNKQSHPGDNGHTPPGDRGQIRRGDQEQTCPGDNSPKRPGTHSPRDEATAGSSAATTREEMTRNGKLFSAPRALPCHVSAGRGMKQGCSGATAALPGCRSGVSGSRRG